MIRRKVEKYSNKYSKVTKLYYTNRIKSKHFVNLSFEIYLKMKKIASRNFFKKFERNIKSIYDHHGETIDARR